MGSLRPSPVLELQSEGTTRIFLPKNQFTKETGSGMAFTHLNSQVETGEDSSVFGEDCIHEAHLTTEEQRLSVADRSWKCLTQHVNDWRFAMIL